MRGLWRALGVIEDGTKNRRVLNSFVQVKGGKRREWAGKEEEKALSFFKANTAGEECNIAAIR